MMMEQSTGRDRQQRAADSRERDREERNTYIKNVKYSRKRERETASTLTVV